MNINYSQIQTGNDNATPITQVGFFSLKGDGDEAIVRIMHDTVDTFDIVTTHPVQYNGRFRRLNCIRDPHEPIENCPVCNSGDKVQQRIYIHLIKYELSENNTIVGTPCVWERSISYARTLKGLIDDYGPLSECLFKIRRNGAAGSVNTSYSITYCRPDVYNASVYAKIDGAFDNYKAVGTVVINKSFDELVNYVNTGNLSTPQQAQAPVQPPFVGNTQHSPFNAGYTSNNANIVERPIRRY